MINVICFACDAGMGSSAMAVSMIKKMIPSQYRVINCSIRAIPDDVDVLITHESLIDVVVDRSRFKAVYSINNFLDKEQLNKIIKEIINMSTLNILTKENIKLDCTAANNEEAIRAMGGLLLTSGYIEAPYIDGMVKRDAGVSTYIGNDIAIPHGEYEVKKYVKETGLGVMIYPQGINWQGSKVRVVIGIAAKGDDHMTILSNIALKLSDMSLVDKIVDCNDVNVVYDILTQE